MRTISRRRSRNGHPSPVRPGRLRLGPWTEPRPLWLRAAPRPPGLLHRPRRRHGPRGCSTARCCSIAPAAPWPGAAPRPRGCSKEARADSQGRMDQPKNGRRPLRKTERIGKAGTPVGLATSRAWPCSGSLPERSIAWSSAPSSGGLAGTGPPGLALDRMSGWKPDIGGSGQGRQRRRLRRARRAAARTLSAPPVRRDDGHAVQERICIRPPADSFSQVSRPRLGQCGAWCRPLDHERRPCRRPSGRS